jgi:hypothetical protein
MRPNVAVIRFMLRRAQSIKRHRGRVVLGHAEKSKGRRLICSRYRAHLTHNRFSIMVNAEAGPSRPNVKPKSPHPSHRKVKKLATPLPPKPTSVTTQTLPIKVLQGRAAARTDGTRHGYGREEVFVTRKVSLGALMGRCRSLVVDEG